MARTDDVTTPTCYADIGHDGARPVVWAVGETVESCDSDPDRPERPGETVRVTATPRAVNAVRLGAVAVTRFARKVFEPSDTSVIRAGDYLDLENDVLVIRAGTGSDLGTTT